MGTYYGEPILWRCVDIDGNGPLMLSDKIICIKAFDAEGEANTATGSHSRNSYRQSYGSNYWGDSNMRSWLNSTASAGNVNWLCGNPPAAEQLWSGYNAYDREAGFLTNFTQPERNAMKEVTQKSLVAYPEYDNGIYDGGTERHIHSYYIGSVVQNYDTAYYENVTDKMFLMDVKQVNAVYNNRSTLGEDYYIGEPTAQCVANSEYKSSSLTVGNKWYYWLRSPSSGDNSNVRCVESGGSVYNGYADGNSVGVRPAFYLNLTSSSVKSGAGTDENPYTIDGGTGDGTDEPTNSEIDEEDNFPESLTIDYNSKSTGYIMVKDPDAVFEIEDKNVAELDNAVPVLEVGQTEYDETSIDIIPKSPGKTVIKARLSDGTVKECNLTVTGIKITLNGKDLEFDQPPVNQSGSLLVPIRKIAESMGKNVLWSEKAKTAFIDNTDNALIVPIGETNLYLGNEEPYSKWQSVKTNVPSQVINGRTLVPIRQFAEALGAKVDWVDKYSTASITYNNIKSESMSSELFDAINLSYYIGHYTENPFTWYTDNIVEPFYDSRNPAIDAVTMGISKPWSAISDLWSGIYGNTNASNIIQETIYDVLSEVPEDESIELDVSLAKDIKSYAKSGLKLFKETKGLDADFLKNHKILKNLNNSLLKVAESDKTSKVFDIFDWSVFTAEEIAYLLSDYSVNISYLDALEKALDNQGILDGNMEEAIEDLRAKYSDKFAEVTMDFMDEIVGNAFGESIAAFTGSGYSLGKFVWDKVFKFTGVSKKGSALKSFYGIYCYNAALDREFDDAILAAKTDVDINYIKALIKLQKATKSKVIDNIADMANWWAKKEVNQSAEELKTSLNSWTYYVWEKS